MDFIYKVGAVEGYLIVYDRSWDEIGNVSDTVKLNQFRDLYFHDKLSTILIAILILTSILSPIWSQAKIARNERDKKIAKGIFADQANPGEDLIRLDHDLVGAVDPLDPRRPIAERPIDAGLPQIGRFEHVRVGRENQGQHLHLFRT